MRQEVFNPHSNSEQERRDRAFESAHEDWKDRTREKLKLAMEIAIGSTLATAIFDYFNIDSLLGNFEIDTPEEFLVVSAIGAAGIIVNKLFKDRREEY